MSTGQLTVMLLCAVLGYWLVSTLMDRFGNKNRRDSRDNRPPPRDEPPPRARGPYARPDTGGTQQRPSAEPQAGDAVTLSNWYRILGVPENATREAIAAAYKKKISQHHPDKVAQMGEEIRALAEAKSKQINAAYEFGMRLYK